MGYEEKILLWIKLKNCREYAISKAIKKFHNIPLERSDFITIAWFAFEDTLIKYEKQKGNKSFESFFIDEVYWKCSDYCAKYINNRHRILNNSFSIDEGRNDYDFISEFSETSIDEKTSIKSLIYNYYQSIENKDKKIIVRELWMGKNLKEITNDYGYSKSKVYRLREEIQKDLKQLLY